MILYISNLKEYTKNLLALMNEFSKVVDTGPMYKNHLYFYALTMNT